MTAIERTAYPRLKVPLSRRELNELYTPLPRERAFVQAHSRGSAQQLAMMILLKSFQSLGFFPPFEEVPDTLIQHLRQQMKIDPQVRLEGIPAASLYRYHRAIREFLGVAPYQQGGEEIARQTLHQAALLMNDPADLISAVVEELVRQRYELPGYSSLERMAAAIREEVNQGYYQLVMTRLSEEEQVMLSKLPRLQESESRSDFAQMKDPAGRAVMSHMLHERRRLRWLEGLLDTEAILKDIPSARVAQFAKEARALEAGDILRYQKPYQYTLLVSLIHWAKIQVRDNLATMLIKRLRLMHKHAQEALQKLREEQRKIAERMVEMMGEVIDHARSLPDDLHLGQAVRQTLADVGDIDMLHAQVQALSTHHGNNILPFLPSYYQSYRPVLFEIVEALDLFSSTQDQSLIEALIYLKQNRARRADFLPADVSIAFASQAWQDLIRSHSEEGDLLYKRRYFEICVFSYVVAELQTGDLCIHGSEEYGDTREQLLPWKECEALLGDYCQALGFASTATTFVEQLKTWFTQLAREVDQVFLEQGQLSIKEGKPILKRLRAEHKPPGTEILKNALQERMPEQGVLEALAFVDKLLHFTRHFGPLSGSDPKVKAPRARYVMTCFAYGSNIGPTQAARHSSGQFSAKDLSRTNLHHITAEKLDAAIQDIINFYIRFDLPRFWGSGKAAAADGTLINIYTNNLLSAYHIRYGAYGGIAYHHIADNYILLFSHFISVGVWEAVYIIDGLLKNHSLIQPELLHADTQGQSLTVFGLSHLLGIQLMPRIRNWKDLILYRPSQEETYQHIDDLFSDVINWKLIETHWQDLMQVILSIQAGRILPSALLRKLTNESQKNRLFRAFQELGKVIRTAFLLRYVTDLPLRRQITATTNKVEAYNGFSAWITFGGDKIIAHNDPIEMEKRIKYTDLIATALILKTTLDMTVQLHSLHGEGYLVNPETVARLSPYMTEHYQRFGKYSLALSKISIDPFPFEMPFGEPLVPDSVPD